MSQINPELPSNLAHIPNYKMKNAVSDGANRSIQRPEDRNCDPCPLRPAPLFRSIGHMGLSASLPPHRRLRSILHRASAVLPANSNSNRSDSISSWCEGDTDSSLNYALHNDALPDIFTYRIKSQTRQEAQSSSGQHSLKETKIPNLSSFQFREESCLKSGSTCTAWRRHSTGHVSKRTVVFPLTQSDTDPSETPTATERSAKTSGKRWNRKVNKTQAFGQSEHTPSSQKGEKTDISSRFHSLAINTGEKQNLFTTIKDLQVCTTLKNRSSTRKVSAHGSENEVKEARHARRDRRPHFLPPISHLGCLLDVPLVLPENSPPPSPSCGSSPPFFPLHVPASPLQLLHEQKDT